MSSNSIPTEYYPYKPNAALPIVFSCLVGLSLAVHIGQNIYHRTWKVMFFAVWAGSVFTAGWIMRSLSAIDTTNQAKYIAQTVLILAGPPIYSAVEYNILGRLMLYLPMHAPMNPDRLVYFFVYLGAAVESLTVAGGSRMASAGEDTKLIQSGATFIAVASALQGVVQCLFVSMVGLLHYRCVASKMLTRKVLGLCIMLYGTSALVLLRCIFRTVENFTIADVVATSICGPTCQAVLRHEWFLYALEAAPMVLYTYWLNVVHPGRFLPSKNDTYLDFDKVERAGPGWIDRRSQWQTFVDPLDLGGLIKGQPAHEKFWLRPDEWPVLQQADVEAMSLDVVDGKSRSVAAE